MSPIRQHIRRQLSRFLLASTTSLLASTASLAQTTTAPAPAYLKNAQDPVQQTLSQALLGFAFQKKCAIEPPPEEAAYEGALNHANEVFKAYALAKGFVGAKQEAANYAREMAMGAIRYAATQSCDDRAREKVRTGHQLAAGFDALIEGALKASATK